jgi:hypothetical protein
VMSAPRVDADIKVAFVGDSGTGPASQKVLELIVAEGAKAVVHLGDFGYESTADQFKKHLDKHLPGLPFFAAAGNHDIPELDEYEKILDARLPADAVCEGRSGRIQACSFRGLFFVLGAVDMIGTDQGYADYITKRMGAASERWKICGWHKPSTKIQAGKNGDGSGWAPYRACLAQGAFIATGHEHSYSRTHQLDAFPPAEQPVSTSNEVELSPGRTFTFVSGAGGRALRPAGPNASKAWQAVTYMKMSRARKKAEREKAKKGQEHRAGAGALFCTFGGSKPDKAECYFKDIGGAEIDRFTLVSKL